MDDILARLAQDIKDRGNSRHTMRLYLGQIQKFARHFDVAPQDLTSDQVAVYSRHLADKHGPGSATQHMFAAAARFFFEVTRKETRALIWLRVPRRAKKLPEIMRLDEIEACIHAAASERDRAFVMLGFGAGLRIGEVSGLLVSDIDSQAGVIHIRAGKGKKDRLVMLSPTLLLQLRRYWLQARPGRGWLFPGGVQGQPLTQRHIRRAWRDTQLRAGLERHYKYHTLRHCFATYVLDEGADLQTTQVLLGHARLSSTLRYVLVQPRHVNNVRSPLERFGLPTAEVGPKATA